MFEKEFSPADAEACGLINPVQRADIEGRDLWKEFSVDITSTFDHDAAQEFLKESIPNLEGLSVIVVESLE